MIEALQQQMGATDFWDLNPVILKGDVGAVRAHRRRRRLRRGEAGETVAEE